MIVCSTLKFIMLANYYRGLHIKKFLLYFVFGCVHNIFSLTYKEVKCSHIQCNSSYVHRPLKMKKNKTFWKNIYSYEI